ncbi:B12-binding domain-containing radical SAM protein [candidate division CSSED10-310 bacterium]|uniref:B12-binding domain-containing radical SAM protein n=1 Tax=candidate division CSSED10-310 bacterium TaxID=2855610 RepID=A0ABV6YWB0_UNCC1
MKVLLINPMSTTHYQVPPLGLGYLATALEKHGHEPFIIDGQRAKTSMTDLRKAIIELKPALVGVQAFSYDMLTAAKIITMVKRLNPTITTVIGGAHSSGVGKAIFFSLPELDFSFRGEAETGLSYLADFLSESGDRLDLAHIPGLMWRTEGTIQENPQAFPENLDALGFPRWDLIDPRTYPRIPQGGFYRQAPIAPIITSRGCPFPCTFCAGKTLTGRKLRMRSIEHLMAEIELLVNHFQVRELHIVDDTFTSHKKRVHSFCEALLQKDWNLSFTMPNGVRLDTLDREVLKAMKKAGCYALIVGIESGSQNILDDMKKGITLAEITEKIHLINDMGMSVRGFFIIGYPTETFEDFQKTIRFALSLPLSGAHFSSFLPLPGSEITEQLLAEGILKNIPYESLFYSLIPLPPPGMTQKQVKKWIRKAYLRFYLRPTQMGLILKEIHSLKLLQALVRRFWDYAF